MKDSELRDLYCRWQAEVKHLAPATIHETRTLLAQLHDWAIGTHEAHRYADLSTERLEQFATRLNRNGTKPSAATVAKTCSLLRGFFSWCEHRGYIVGDASALLVGPGVRNVQPKPLSEDDWCHLWDQAGYSERLAFGLGYYLGLRRAEWGAIRCNQVDLDNRLIVGFTRKGGGDDTLPYGAMLDLWVQKLDHERPKEFGHLLFIRANEERDAWLLPWADTQQELSGPTIRKYGLAPGQISPKRVSALFKAEVDRLGVRCTPHQLRHSCATNMLRCGVPLPIASRLLNHSSVTTTMRYIKAGGMELSEWLESST